MPKLLGIEIMPYHDFGKSKALAIGSYYEIQARSLNQEEKEQLRKNLRSCGCGLKILDSF